MSSGSAGPGAPPPPGYAISGPAWPVWAPSPSAVHSRRAGLRGLAGVPGDHRGAARALRRPRRRLTAPTDRRATRRLRVVRGIVYLGWALANVIAAMAPITAPRSSTMTSTPSPNKSETTSAARIGSTKTTTRPSRRPIPTNVQTSQDPTRDVPNSVRWRPPETRSRSSPPDRYSAAGADSCLDIPRIRFSAAIATVAQGG